MLDSVKTFVKNHKKEFYFLASTSISIGMPALLGLPLLPVIGGIAAVTLADFVVNALLKTYIIKPLKEMKLKDKALHDKLSDWYAGKENGFEEVEKHIESKYQEVSNSYAAIAKVLSDRNITAMNTDVDNSRVDAAIKTLLKAATSATTEAELKVALKNIENSLKNKADKDKWGSVPHDLDKKLIHFSRVKVLLNKEKITVDEVNKVLPDLLKANKSQDLALWFDLSKIVADDKIPLKDLQAFYEQNKDRFNPPANKADFEDAAKLRTKLMAEYNKVDLELVRDNTLYLALDKYKKMDVSEVEKVKAGVEKYKQFNTFKDNANTFVVPFVFGATHCGISGAFGSQSAKILTNYQVVFQGLKASLPAILATNIFVKCATTCSQIISSYICPFDNKINVFESTVKDSISNILFGSDKVYLGVDFVSKYIGDEGFKSTIALVAKSGLSQGIAKASYDNTYSFISKVSTQEGRGEIKDKIIEAGKASRDGFVSGLKMAKNGLYKGAVGFKDGAAAVFDYIV